MSKTVKEIAAEIGVSKQAVFKKMKREPLSTGLQGLTTTVDGRLMVSVDGEKLIKQAFLGHEPSTTDNRLPSTVDGLVDGPSTKSEEKTAEVDGENRLYEILEKELQAKNEQIAAQQAEIANLQCELSAERQHSREQAEKLAVLVDQSQRLQLAQMAPLQLDQGGTSSSGEEPEGKEKRSIWRRIFG